MSAVIQSMQFAAEGPALRISAFFLALVASAAFGQSDTDALAAARACGGIEDDAERLACLDVALGVDSSEVDSARPEPEAIAVDDAPEEVERTIRIVEIRRSAFGVTTFITDGGERWAQRSGAAGRYPRVPFEAHLQPGMGDSFFLSSPIGGPRVRVLATQ